MAILNWTEIPEDFYNNLIYPLIVRVEETGDPKLAPYNDAKNNLGYITIGSGFNLTDSSIFNAVVNKIFYPDGTPTLTIAADNDYKTRLFNAVKSKNIPLMDEIMAERANDVNVDSTQKRSTFSFLNVGEVNEVFLEIKSTYEDKIDNKLFDGIPFSTERLVLFSLAYNTRDGATSLLGPSLKQALLDGNRAEAWYEIRYGSNGNDVPGIAKRRYYESDLFRLYDENLSPDDQSKKIFQMMTRHHEQIETYDTDYGGQVALAERDYKTNVLTTDEALLPAKNYLVDIYAHGQQIDKIWIDFVPKGGTAETNNLDFSSRTENALFLGGDGNDIIKGGSGSDVLYGEKGNDTLNGGGGIDTAGYLGGPAAITAHLDVNGQHTVTDGWGNTDTLISIERIVGSQFDDTFYGANGITIDGAGGYDTLSFMNSQNGVSVSAEKIDGTSRLVINIPNGDGISSYTTYAYGIERLNLTSASDTVTLPFADGRTIDGGGGVDTVTYEDDTGRGIAYDAATGKVYTRDSYDTLLNIENIHSSSGVVTVLVDSHHNGTLMGIVEGTSGGGYHTQGALNSYVLAESGATIHLTSTSTLYATGVSHQSWTEQAIVNAEVTVGGATQSGRIYAFGSTQTPTDSSPLQHSGYSTLIGTNRGDHVTISGAASGMGSYGWIGFISGLGHDDITIEDGHNYFDSNVRVSVVYTGGNDEISGNLGSLSLAPDIRLEDVSVGSIGISGYDIQTGAYEYSAILEIANHGSVYIENFGVDEGFGMNQVVQIVLQSGGSDLYVSLSGDIFVAGFVASPVLWGGEEVYLGSSRNLQGSEDIDTLSGGYKDDVLYGWGGNDILSGNLGNDTIYGGAGNDTIYGGGGDDLIYGESGENILYGGAGNDTFFMQFGALETATGGQGNDIYKLSRYTWNATITDTTGSNIITFDNVVASELTYRIQNDSLSVYLGNNKLATIAGYQDHFSFAFQDGTTLTSQQFMDASSVYVPPIPVITYGGYGVSAYAMNDGQTYEYRLTDGNDTFFGSDVKDIIKGYGGNDVFLAYGGDDVMDGGDGQDAVSYYYSHSGITADLAAHTILDGDGGTDTVNSIEMIYGSFFNDTINGDDNDNYLYGNGGDDIIHGYGGNDELQGDDGNDYIYGGDGNDVIFSGRGNDVMDGGNGQDGLSYYYASSGVTVDLAAHTALDGDGGTDAITNIEIIYGSVSYDDVIAGDDNANIICGNGGSDTLSGRAGNDTLYGGDGNDLISGDDGDDFIDGGSGYDTASYISAENGVVVSLAIAGAQNTGSAGYDTLIGVENIIGSQFDDGLYGDDGSNIISGNDGDDELAGGKGNDFLYGGLGSDTYVYYAGDGIDTIEDQGEESDTLYIGGGLTVNDIASISAEANDNVRIIFEAGVSEILLSKQNATGYGIEHIYFEDGTYLDIRNYTSWAWGTSHADYMYGSLDSDTIIAGAGNDEIYAKDGNDIVHGGLGDDIIYGQAGNDQLFGDAGNDTLSGALGNDELHGGDGVDQLFGDEGDDFLYGDNGNDILYGSVGNDVLSGGAGDDILYGEIGNDALYGDAGADTLYGDLGNDTLYGGAGNDILHGGDEDDTLFGDDGNDQLFGDVGNDKLSGGAGDDHLYGGWGLNTMTGGLGADVFVFDVVDYLPDTVKDFSVAEGDKIDVKDLLVGYDDVTSAIADFVEFTSVGANTVIKVDRDGSSTTYGWQQIATLENVTGLTDESALRASGNLIA